jgi:hypothetical protein
MGAKGGNYKREREGRKGREERGERTFSFPGALKIYADWSFCSHFLRGEQEMTLSLSLSLSLSS